ncbi:MAG: FAD-dependent monooxygenase [Propionibacteriaceae bacterium]
MRVVVVGAGIGGLVLAQGLMRAGHEVLVLERDEGPAVTGGYRLHLDARACAVLRQVLDPDVWAAVQASGAGRSAFRRFTMTDRRLRVLAVECQDPGEEVLMIGRVALRTLLTSGLGDRVRWGVPVSSVAMGATTATATLADGSTVDADLVVGADGPRSVVARTLAGRALVTSVGVGGIAGRTPLDDYTRSLLPELLSEGPLLAFSPAGVVVFLTVHDPSNARVVDPELVGAVRAVTEPPALVWGVNAADQMLPTRAGSGGGAALVRAATELLQGWHPKVRALVAAADPSSVASYSFYAPDPSADLMPWPAGRLVALGDAVHAVPPTGGQGATTAIRDAGHLIARLRQVTAGELTLGSALASFQRDVAAYAPAAVSESLQPLRWARLVSRPGVRQAATLALPVLATLTDAWHGRARAAA